MEGRAGVCKEPCAACSGAVPGAWRLMLSSAGQEGVPAHLSLLWVQLHQCPFLPHSFAQGEQKGLAPWEAFTFFNTFLPFL